MKLNGQICLLFKEYAKVYFLSGSDGIPFYVGVTLNPVGVRLNQHINEARVNRVYSNAVKNLAIQNMNFEILITVIDTVWVTAGSPSKLKGRASQIDHPWILKYRSLGYNLVNIQPYVKQVYFASVVRRRVKRGQMPSRPQEMKISA